MVLAKRLWLQKAVAIVASIAIALGLAAGFAPAKADAASPATAITAVSFSGYSDPVAGEWASDNWGQLSYECTPSSTTSHVGGAFSWRNASDPTVGISKFEAGQSYFLNLELFVDADHTGNEMFSPSISAADVTIPGATVASVTYSASNMITIKTDPYTVPEAAADEYKMTQGNGASWTKGSGEELVFTSDAPFDKFVAVMVDADELSEDQCKVESGSTVVTLYPEYLETLSVGRHTIGITSEMPDGNNATVHGTFVIKAAAVGGGSYLEDSSEADAAANAVTAAEITSPKTGGESASLAVPGLVLGLCGLAGAMFLLRVRKEGC